MQKTDEDALYELGDSLTKFLREESLPDHTTLVRMSELMIADPPLKWAKARMKKIDKFSWT